MLKNTFIHSFFYFSRRFLPGRLYPFRDRIFSIFNLRIKNVIVPIGEVFVHVDTNNYHERSLFSFGAFERGTTEFLKRYISTLADCVVVDIGANIGIHTLTMARARNSGSNVSIISVEPNSDMVVRLKKNLSINRIRGVHVCECGVSSTVDRIKLGLPYAQDCDEYHNPGIASMVQTDSAVRSIEVECRPLDDIVKSLGYDAGQVALIKMDIEGKELDALHGMQQILRESDAAIIIEFNDKIFDQCVDHLNDYGFEVVGSLLRYGIDANVRSENVLFMKSVSK